MNEWLLEHLVCPRDRQRLELTSGDLRCSEGHVYPVVFDVPVMLLDDVKSTHSYIEQSLEYVRELRSGAAPEQTFGELEIDEIDKFVQAEVPYTSGTLYFSVQNKLKRYPIPDTRLESGKGRQMIDIGCNWGRWSIAAARKGYKVVGLDPSLKAILAAKRVSRQLDVDCNFVVGDARFLPFADDSFDTVFCYSVYQHMSKENVSKCLDEDVRVLKNSGTALIQMPNKYGIRQYQQHRRRGFTEGKDFEIRYWTPNELARTFTSKFGEAPTMSTDCYFGLGIQAADIDLLPARYKAVVLSSEFIRVLSRIFPPLVKVADSIYLSVKNRKIKEKRPE